MISKTDSGGGGGGGGGETWVFVMIVSLILGNDGMARKNFHGRCWA